jgi:hypothetical protein
MTKAGTPKAGTPDGEGLLLPGGLEYQGATDP